MIFCFSLLERMFFVENAEFIVNAYNPDGINASLQILSMWYFISSQSAYRRWWSHLIDKVYERRSKTATKIQFFLHRWETTHKSNQYNIEMDMKFWEASVLNFRHWWKRRFVICDDFFWPPSGLGIFTSEDFLVRTRAELEKQ